MSNITPSSTDFGASELGTKEYWDTVYSLESTNFPITGNIGEVWFGPAAVEKIINWVLVNAPSKNSRILDLGCGNGHILLELATHNFNYLTGIDYSPHAIQLA